MSGRSRVVGTLLCLAVALVPPAAAEEPAVRAVVDGLHQTLLAVMKEAKALGPKGRFARLAAPIEQSFHLAAMIRIATGSSWKDANPAQQERLVAAFARMSVATYASRFDGFSGESFAIVGEKPGPRETRLVDTRIERPGEAPVPITYVMTAADGRWRIVDVLLEKGISELAVRRSEYRRILATDGVDGLVASLNKKAGELVGE